jgi:hypothetical protein
MKKLIRGIFVPLIISVLFGFVCGKIIYNLYNDEISNNLSSSKIYLIENGEYLTYDNMREENNGNNYVYYKDEEGYKTVVGITRDEDNIDKIKNLYSDSLEVEEYYVSNELLNEKQNEYDKVLNETDDIYEVKKVVDNILSLYCEDDTIRLVLVK